MYRQSDATFESLLEPLALTQKPLSHFLTEFGEEVDGTFEVVVLACLAAGLCYFLQFLDRLQLALV